MTKLWPCRCPGKGFDEKPNTEAEGDGGVLELRSCDGCGCTFALPWVKPKLAPGHLLPGPPRDSWGEETGVYTPDPAAPAGRNGRWG